MLINLNHTSCPKDPTLKKFKPSLSKAFFLVLISILLGICGSYSLNASPKKQKITSKRKYNIAEKFLANGNYSRASVIYKELLEKNSRNSDLNFKLGVCYLNMVSEKEKSVDLLENAIQYTNSKNNVSLDVYFNLAKAYHTNYQFREALKVYKDMMQIISPQNTEFRNEIKREMKMCKNGLELVKSPVNISIVNLGNKINTEFAEHSPGVTADESMMVFTSRRNGTGSKIDIDGQYFEDIYISHLVNGKWTEPQGIAKLNTIDHDASISVSADGQELYIYKAGYLSRKESEGGDIYVSRLDGDNWTTPEKLGPSINSKSKESHISISADARTIFFSSDRPGGYGGMDIYTVSKLPNGKWGKAKNLGPAINTEYNDDAPFIHPDGKTLYFSSAGHKTMGGLDIFKSVNIKGRWTTPMNIGYPINSTDDDIYYTPTPDGKRAYFASYRKGSKGRTDIFLVKTPDAEKVGLFVLKGKIINSQGQVVAGSKVTVSKNGKTVGIYTPNSATGKFLFIVDAGKKYNIEIVADGYRTLRTILNIPPEYANKENHSVITLLPLTLRTKSEADYPKTLELIDIEESKLNQVMDESLQADSIPENKKFTDTQKGTENTTKDTIATLIKKDAVNSNVSTDIKPIDNKQDTTGKLNTVQKAVTPVKEQAKKDAPATSQKAKSNKIKNQSGTNTGLTPIVPLVPKALPKVPITSTKKESTQVAKTNSPATKKQNKKEFTQIAKTDLPGTKTIKDQSKKSNIVVKPKSNIQKQSSINAQASEVKAIDSGDLAFTLDLGNFNSPQPELFEELDGVTETIGPDKKYHYTYGKFKDYKEVSKVQKVLKKKGYKATTIRILSKDNLVKEISGGDQYYTIQIMALKNIIGPEFFDNIDNVEVFKGSNGMTCYTYMKFRSYEKAVKEMNRLIRMGYWDAFIRTVINGKLIHSDLKYNYGGTYTIQVMALNYPRALSKFNDLGRDVQVFVDDNGMYRYTYGTYSSKGDAIKDLKVALTNGYWDAFVRKSLKGERLPLNNSKLNELYTIQVMALNKARPISYFKELGADSVNVYSGKDGLSRYTFKTFSSQTKAKQDLPKVKKRGYFDAFTRKIKWYNQN